MATITVTNNADSGDGSLRNALANAADGDTIVFAPSVAGETIKIGSSLNINTAVTIDGGNQNIAIDGQSQYTDFNVSLNNGGAASITNLTIENGHGVGQDNSGAPPITVNGGNAGGGIYTRSDLNLSNDSFINNSAEGGNGSPAGSLGGTNKAAGNGGNAAGAVYVENGVTVTASNLVFSGNTATPGQGGTADDADGLPAGSGGSASPDSNDPDVNAAAVCFVSGTLIRTTRGDVAVECLAVGDIVITVLGETRPVRWMGRQTVVAAFADPIRSFPIRIAAGAIDDNVPARDLYLSPDHALVIDDVLVQAGALVNGTTVTRVTDPGDRFMYHHIETEDHAIILAEGAPAETFVSNVTRRTFDNYAEWEGLFGSEYEAEPIDELEQPRAMSQRQVPKTIRARMAARATALGWREAA